MTSNKKPRAHSIREERKKRAGALTASDIREKKPSKVNKKLSKTPKAPGSLLELVENFLHEHGYAKAGQELAAEITKREAVDEMMSKNASKGYPTLIELFNEWLEGPGKNRKLGDKAATAKKEATAEADQRSSSDSDSSSASESSDEEDTVQQKTQKKDVSSPEASSIDGSDDESSSSSDSNTGVANATPPSTASSSGSSSSSSDTSSESSSEEEKTVKKRATNKLKRKA